MVNLFKRMRKLKSLLNVRLGPGAAILPTLTPGGGSTSTSSKLPAVTRMHLTYARYIYGGHQGSRHFWRNCLTRLKYHNPALPITVKQTLDQEGPAALTIYFDGKVPNSAEKHNAANRINDQHAPKPAENEKTVVIDAKNLTYTEIWDRVKEATGAQEVQATDEEKAELEWLEQLKKKSEVDRARVAAIRQAKKDQERMLQEARGEAEKLRQQL